MDAFFVVFILFTSLIRTKNANEIVYTCNRTTSSCGCSLNSAVLSRIVGGEEVLSRSWGWTVGLYRSNKYFCVGSLISSDLILTAAHCMYPELSTLAQMTIIAGTNSLSNTDGKGQIRHVFETFIHPDYNKDVRVNDVAITRVSVPFDMSNVGLAIICLPEFVTAESIAKLEYPIPGTTLVVVGWGVLDYGDNDPSPSLRQVTVKAVASTSTDCTTSVKELVNVTSQFCAGVPGGRKDTCQGDSGGPIMAFVSNRWQIVGVTSNGYGCAEPGHSGIYTRVTYYIPFIETILNKSQTEYKSVMANSSKGRDRWQMTVIKIIIALILTGLL